jgi:hypothetical protein
MKTAGILPKSVEKPLHQNVLSAFIPAASAWLPSIGRTFRVDIAAWMLLPASRVRETP